MSSHSTAFPDDIDRCAASNAEGIAKTCASDTGNGRFPSIVSTNASSSACRTLICRVDHPLRIMSARAQNQGNVIQHLRRALGSEHVNAPVEYGTAVIEAMAGLPRPKTS